MNNFLKVPPTTFECLMRFARVGFISKWSVCLWKSWIYFKLKCVSLQEPHQFQGEVCVFERATPISRWIVCLWKSWIHLKVNCVSLQEPHQFQGEVCVFARATPISNWSVCLWKSWIHLKVNCVSLKEPHQFQGEVYSWTNIYSQSISLKLTLDSIMSYSS